MLSGLVMVKGAANTSLGPSAPVWVTTWWTGRNVTVCVTLNAPATETAVWTPHTSWQRNSVAVRHPSLASICVSSVASTCWQLVHQNGAMLLRGPGVKMTTRAYVIHWLPCQLQATDQALRIEMYIALSVMGTFIPTAQTYGNLELNVPTWCKVWPPTWQLLTYLVHSLLRRKRIRGLSISLLTKESKLTTAM